MLYFYKMNYMVGLGKYIFDRDILSWFLPRKNLIIRGSIAVAYCLEVITITIIYLRRLVPSSVFSAHSLKFVV